MALLFTCLLTSCTDPIEIDVVKSGQVWTYELNKGNPFRVVEIKDYLIMDVKDGFVKYKDLETGAVDSASISWFKVGSTLKGARQ